jgi:hypothetical protein
MPRDAKQRRQFRESSAAGTRKSKRSVYDVGEDDLSRRIEENNNGHLSLYVKHKPINGKLRQCSEILAENRSARSPPSK